jgi:hypothetical protein
MCSYSVTRLVSKKHFISEVTVFTCYPFQSYFHRKAHTASYEPSRPRSILWSHSWGSGSPRTPRILLYLQGEDVTIVRNFGSCLSIDTSYFLRRLQPHCSKSFILADYRLSRRLLRRWLQCLLVWLSTELRGNCCLQVTVWYRRSLSTRIYGVTSRKRVTFRDICLRQHFQTGSRAHPTP